MKCSIGDLPLVQDTEDFVSREVIWGANEVSVTEIHTQIDVAPLLKGLPDDQCQCPHWGYMLKGQMRATIGDQEEIFNEGDLYYLPPGHSVVLEAGSKYIEWSPTVEVEKTRKVISQNLEALNR